MKKLARQTRALERFTVMSFNSWMKQHGYEHGNEASLGMILARQLYVNYVYRKSIEELVLLKVVA